MDYLAYGHRGAPLAGVADHSTTVIDPELGLYLLCDGLGGRTRGTVAAKTAASLVHGQLQAQCGSALSAADPRALVPLIVGAIQHASQQMRQLAETEAALAWMGATITLLLTVGESAVIAHVGDSRVYLSRDDELHPLTVDHTLSSQLVAHGVLSETDAQQQALLHGVVRALGTHPTVAVDTLVVDVLLGDLFLICSGAVARLGEPTLRQLVSTTPPPQLAAELVAQTAQQLGDAAVGAIALQASVDEATKPLELERSGRLQVKRALIADSPLFAGLSWRELSEVLAIAKTRTLPAGEILFPANGPNDQLVLVMWGELEVQQNGRPYRRIKPGEWFGAAAFVDDRALPGPVLVTENARLICIPVRELDQLFLKKPRIGTRALRNLAQHFYRRLEKEAMGWPAE